MIQTIKKGRSIHFNSVAGLGAVIRPSKNSTKSGAKCGDAILIDLKHHFFAVADSPDRSPDASRDFLHKFSQMLNEHYRDGLHEGGCTKSVEEAAARLIEQTNKLIASIEYYDNTTFTGIQIYRTGEQKRALLLHCGDSLMYHLRRQEHKAEKISENNRYFVGRTKELAQTLLFEYYDDSRFLLATDGFLNIRKNSGFAELHCLPEKLIETLAEEPVDQLPGILLQRFDLFPETGDDVGVITLDPNQVLPAPFALCF